jgi:condensin complex subunit 1
MFEYGKFTPKMDEACQLLNLMLSSKSVRDTVEVIRVFKLLHQYGLPQANQGIRKMLTLVFSKEASLQKAVEECYTSIYFADSIRAQEKVRHLLDLMKDASLTDITCIEELLHKLIKEDVFEKECFNILWVNYMEFGRNMG